MKIFCMPLVLGLSLFPLCASAQVGGIGGGGGLRTPPKRVGEGQKEALNRKILQVLPEGLLFSGSGTSTFVLTGHPDEKSLADGEVVNCYVSKTEETLKYTAVNGAERTARIYRYVTRRIGGR